MAEDGTRGHCQIKTMEPYWVSMHSLVQGCPTLPMEICCVIGFHSNPNKAPNSTARALELLELLLLESLGLKLKFRGQYISSIRIGQHWLKGFLTVCYLFR